jgi:uncharacterized protein involved in exopolysaccharide biosynthesis
MERSDVEDNDEDAGKTPATNASLFDRRDREKVRNYASFLRGSVRRHRLLVAAVFVAVVGGAVGSLLALPKTYHVETKALAQPNSALTVRGDGPGADSLTRVAADTVLRHDNLLALVQQTNLLEYTTEHRAPAQVARDALLKTLRVREESSADQLDALVTRLEKKLSVWTSDSGNTVSGSTVTIAIDWPDGPMACRLVDAAQRAFLDARYAREITALSESIAILQKHTSSLQEDIDIAVGSIQRMRMPSGELPAGAAPVAAPARPRWLSTRAPAVPRAPATTPELREIQSQLDAKERAIQELEGLRRQRLSELQAQLAEARTTYTESHPTITNLKQSLAALAVDSPQLAGLRLEAASLREQYDARNARPSDPTPPAVVWTTAPPSLAGAAAGTPPQVPSDVLRLALDLREDRDPGMVYARGQLRDAMDKYAALRTQIQSAQIDLETAQAAFKYRYTVVTPAHLPKSPAAPNVPLVVLVAVLAGLLGGLLLAVLADLRRGRLLERWQIERLLERPILGDITLPDDAEGA